jgi:P-type Cu+ transporter
MTTMIDSKAATTDPVCGLTVDEATPLQAERNGNTFRFCSSECREAFLSTPKRATETSGFARGPF